jgi:replication factor C small subunit
MEELEFTPRTERKQHIWVEKYRPKKLADYLGNPLIKETFSSYITNQNLPHILLYGGPGTGKTTASKLLVKEIESDSIYINASDERTLDVIRDKIKIFASSTGFKPLKIVILDEFDGFPDLSQRTLRSILETHSLNTRFILTANYHERIIEPIQSRCQVFEVFPPPKKEVALHLIEILKAENITFTNEDLAVIVNAYYPDIRKVIQFAQQSSLTGELKLSRVNLIEQDIKNKIVEMLKVKMPLIQIRKYIIEQNLTRFEEIYQHLYENLDKYAEGKQASMILNLADAIRNDTMVVNKQIVFMEFLIKSLQSLKSS